MSGRVETSGRIDFARVNAVALDNAESVIRNLFPDGRREGNEWCARNPHRDDRRLGSFKVNIQTGKFCDFATGERGGDLVGLTAFVLKTNQRAAAIQLANALGISPFVGGRP